MDHQHRWMRYQDPVTDAWNHWCIDGDTEHHDEPCQDAADHTGDHAEDVPTAGDWPTPPSL